MSQLCMLTSSYTTSLISQGLQEMYTTKTLLDLEIFDLQDETLHAHSCVLATVSPVVKKHLLSSGPSQRIQRLCFQDISASEWRIILDFVYLGEVIISVEQVRSIIKIVQSLEIEELVELCQISLEQSSILHGTPTAELDPSLETPQAVDAVTSAEPAPVPIKTQSLVRQKPPEAFQRSQRFPQPSSNPGRGSQCPYTKDGHLAKHRLAPLATGSISGPFGTVEISTNELDTQELMKRVNQAFFGEEENGSGDPPKKKRRLEEATEEPAVKIKTEVQVNKPEEQFVYIQETGEIQTLSSLTEAEPIKVATAQPKVVKKDNVEEKSAQKSKKTLYKCTKCDLKFPFGPKLKRHEEEHHTARKTSNLEFRCETCQKEFKSARALNFHVRMNCTPLHSCKVCSEKFHFKYHCDDHVIKNHPDEARTLFPSEHKCPLCDETFKSVALMNHHKGQVHRGWKKKAAKMAALEGSHVFTCELCLDQEFENKSALDQHVRLQHTEATCEFCRETCENWNALIDHLQECSEAPPGEALRQLKMTETVPESPKRKGRPVNCPHCQARFPSKAALVRHNNLDHEGKDMTYCTECQKKFQTITAFRNHMMRHYGIRPFKCDVCERRFSEERDMLKHKANKHSNERPHKCPFCEWAFKDVSALYGHAKRKHLVKLGRNHQRRNTEVDMSDETLAELLVEECASKRQDDPTECVICHTKFQRRGNMYMHAKAFHNRNFNLILKASMREQGLTFPPPGQPVQEAQVIRIGEGATKEEAEESIIQKDDATGSEQMITAEYVEQVAGGEEGQAIVLQESDLQQHCPICSEDCGDKQGIVLHSREVHDVDLTVLFKEWSGKIEPVSE